jgi:cytochrome c551/c552
MVRSKFTQRMRMRMQSMKVFFLASLLLCTFTMQAQPDGAALYKQYCKACHSEGTDKTVGPGLKEVTKNRSKDWLKKWIKSSTSLIQSGDADAKKIFDEYKGMVMPDQNLSDLELDALITYLETLPNASEGGGQNAAAGAAPAAAEPESKSWLFWTVVLILAFFFGMLYFINKQRRAKELKSLTTNYENAEVEFTSFVGRHRKWFFLAFSIVLVVGLKSCWDMAMMVGVSQGYKPTQPINFSHTVHAGQNQISCRYCHSSAFKGKVAGIPSANVCMNCHRYVKTGKRTGTAEIAKIYAALDFDPQTGEYGKNTKPIEWVRVHNLPDLSYFNHAQHVVAGKLDCAECHGDVKKMDVMYQFAPLTMGWCVDCHRKTEVPGMKVNPYYEKLHKGLAKKYPGEKLTVDKMGGLDCAKCHY